MAEPFNPSSLDGTVTARWHRAAVGSDTDRRPHWQTKTAYYRAVEHLLSQPSPQPLTWRAIVDTVRPKGCRSTFYLVAGPHAKLPLIRAFETDGSTESVAVALCYQRSAATDQLIDETKVWSYWPYRARMLAQCREAADPCPRAATAALVGAVVQWVRSNPPLAAALDYAPPVCAVEDLMAVVAGRLSAVRAVSTLSQVMRRAADTSTAISDDALDMLRAGPGPDTRLPPPAPPPVRAHWRAAFRTVA